jgi:hypothetical protein
VAGGPVRIPLLVPAPLHQTLALATTEGEYRSTVELLGGPFSFEAEPRSGLAARGVGSALARMVDEGVLYPATERGVAVLAVCRSALKPYLSLLMHTSPAQAAVLYRLGRFWATRCWTAEKNLRSWGSGAAARP